jgi:membrane protein
VPATVSRAFEVLLRWAGTTREILKETYESWRADRAIRLGAGLAYYAVFAAVPVLGIALGVAGLVFSEVEIEQYLTERLEGFFSEELTEAARELASAIGVPEAGGGLTLFGVVSLGFAATVGFIALQDALNMIWGIPVARGLGSTLQRRLLALGAVLLLGGLLVAVLLVHTIAVAVGGLVPAELEVLGFLDDVLVSVAVWGLGVSVLALLFQFLIQDRLAWGTVFVTSAITGVLLIAGTWVLGIYLRNWSSLTLSSVAGSLLAILLWLYYEAQIIVAGAELLKTLDRRDRMAGSP